MTRKVWLWLLTLVMALNLAACEGADLNDLSALTTDAVATAVTQDIDIDWALVDENLRDAVAEALGITPEELLSRLEAGESLEDIAASLGYTSDDLWALAESLIEQGLLQLDALTQDARGDGVLQPYLVEAWAEALGIPADELQARLDAGETFGEIARSLGYTADEIWALMADVRASAVEQALADGVITEDQAERLLSITPRRQAGEPQGQGQGLQARGETQGDGVLSTYIQQAWAEVLGLSPEDLAARLEAGETLTSIAQSLGYTTDEIQALMDQVRSLAVEQALADGVITEEQAAQILEQSMQQAQHQHQGVPSAEELPTPMGQGQGNSQRRGRRWSP